MTYVREDGSKAVEPVKPWPGSLFPGVFQDAEGKRVHEKAVNVGSDNTEVLNALRAQNLRLAAIAEDVNAIRKVIDKL